MRRRILTAIVGVTILATVVLTVPLAIVSSLRARADAVRELERSAERVAADLSVSALASGDTIELPDTESAVSVGVYLPSGKKLAGDGPAKADDPVSDTDLLTRQAAVGSLLVVTRPIVVNERKLGVIRVSEPLADSEARVRKDLLLLLAFDVAAVGIAAAVGSLVARRLVVPLERIRDDAVRLGNGDFAIGRRSSGVVELDATSEALSETAERLEHTLSREREFSSNASHQLRTPLTVLRLSMESELMTPRKDHAAVLNESLVEIDRLESTIATLLDVARRRDGRRTPLDLVEWIDGVRERWSPNVAAAGRTAHFRTADATTIAVSEQVLDEICDVLVGNALTHGSGEIGVDVSGRTGSLVLTVTDGGALTRDPATLFVRNDPDASGTGVGLALARDLAEGEGGRLVVSQRDPTEFRLVLPDWSIDAVNP